ncbi:MAG: EVE domain-containing protein [Candidatus Muproteobacteria bacterium RBG_16_62_13]|uniref:EVE domain-containing protein n=1 Tax=Candidatus Muproteobacteria bacterium RBG_16_62_13 TaxID=1817756 RepID=A0A1F6T5S2_9PROT|nr:MAG: EVE domain-containing protein [Candidatus Muproteobacteria bacterium RBG_16_62_13]
MAYWLMKSEPDAFGIDDLAKRPKQTEPWNGVRNYQARNFMRDGMKKGDLAFFYHSSCAEPGIAGIVEIAHAAYPDPTARDPESPYYDPRASADNPVWVMVDVRLKKKLKHPVALKLLKSLKPLAGMQLLQRGNRLSVLPVTKKEWDIIIKLAKA